MAWHIKVTDSQPWELYSNEMKENADQIAAELFVKHNWSMQAICALLGSATIESYLNPAQYEYGHGTPTTPYGWGYGVGLIQWTSPDGGRTYPNPWLYYCQQNGVDISDGVEQCKMINGCDNEEYTVMGLSTSIWGWINSSTYPVHGSFEDFKTDISDDLDRLTAMWFYCVEWHSPVEDGSLAERKKNARYWWDYFGGHPLPPTPTGGKRMPFIMYLKRIL